ncbi:MAG: nuclear transport factor 2 family protein [Lysobacterales bacterium]|jgi:hypothetical protein
MNQCTRERIRQQVAQYLDSISKNDPTLAPLAEDAVYGGPMVPTDLRGASAIRQYLGEIAPFIDRVSALRTVIDDDSAAVIMEITGIRKRCWRGSMFFEFKGDLIQSVQVFFDSRLLMQDLA